MESIGAIKCIPTIKEIELNRRIKVALKVYNINGALIPIKYFDANKFMWKVTNRNILRVTRSTGNELHENSTEIKYVVKLS